METENLQPNQEFTQKVKQATEFIGRSMVEDSLHLKDNQKILVIYEPLGKPLADEIKNYCRDFKNPAKINLFKRNLEDEVAIACQDSDEGLEKYFARLKDLNDEADAVFLIRADKNPEIFNKIPKKRQELFESLSHQTNKRRIEGTVPWCLIYWPTPYEAKKEKLKYEDYFQEFIESCKQPWEKIAKAQEKLVKILDQGKILEFKVDEENRDPKKRTNLKMNIEGMSFLGTTIEANYPGSEVYSAPVLDSAEGQVYLTGEYLYEGKMFKNIYLLFNQGKVVGYSADKGEPFLKEIFERTEANRYLGEIAFGTNPGLEKKYFSALLNEKVGGSFHFALGHCYDNVQNQDGNLVKVNNGNTQDKTSLHWDLSSLMHQKYGGGQVILDGKVIQENGRFLDSDLGILNLKTFVV
ncbi:MAG: aminopeptidase [Candidatus Shapirobacteria bacterium]|nr:aminopeptidase [Candidatus Shapirobacteria bacterium]